MPRTAILVALLLSVLFLPAAGGRAGAGADRMPGLDLLGAPVVTTGSDAALNKVDPGLLREAKTVATGSTVGVIIVSQGPLADTRAMMHVSSRLPDPTGLTFTEAQADPSALARIASTSNVIAVLSDTPPQVEPLPDPELARPATKRGQTIGDCGLPIAQCPGPSNSKLKTQNSKLKTTG